VQERGHGRCAAGGVDLAGSKLWLGVLRVFVEMLQHAGSQSMYVIQVLLHAGNQSMYVIQVQQHAGSQGMYVIQVQQHAGSQGMYVIQVQPSEAEKESQRPRHRPLAGQLTLCNYCVPIHIGSTVV
jgi:hypothetical protein